MTLAMIITRRVDAGCRLSRMRSRLQTLSYVSLLIAVLSLVAAFGRWTGLESALSATTQTGAYVHVTNLPPLTPALTRVHFNADAVTPAASETAITFSKTINGTATGSLTAYTVSTGKTLRIDGIAIGQTLTSTTATNLRFALREGASCSTSSAIDVRLFLPGPSAAIATAGSNLSVSYPNGLDFPSTTQICFSAIATSTSSTFTMSVDGFEF